MPIPPEDPSLTGETVSRQSLANRKGYDEDLLGFKAPLPLPAQNGVQAVVLPYTHFSVVFRPDGVSPPQRPSPSTAHSW